MATKKVGEIFSDYQTESVIKEAEVNSLNVSKKDNTLGIILHSPEYLEIKDIWYLEKFLKDRFKFSNIDMKVQYNEETKIKPIKDEWENIICYVSHRYPLAKNMLFKKSDVEVKEDKININMHIPGADFLKAKKADIEVQNTVENLFGKSNRKNDGKSSNSKSIKSRIKRRNCSKTRKS